MSTIYGVNENNAVVSVDISASATSSGVVGEIIYFAGTTVPEHCLACDGSAISRTAYPELFAAIGTTYGEGDSETTFNLPNASGVIYGQVGRTVGESVSAGLPNITGRMGFLVGSGSANIAGILSSNPGCFYSISGTANAYVRAAYLSDYSGNGGWGFDASGSDSIYGNATTVQPEGLVANICIVYE